MPTKPGDDDSNMDSEDSDSDEDSDDEELGGSGAPILQAIYFFSCLQNPILVNSLLIFNFNLIHVHFQCFCCYVQLRKVAHEGCVNRIRAMTQNPHICASWGDTGHVQVRLCVLISWMSLLKLQFQVCVCVYI